MKSNSFSDAFCDAARAVVGPVAGGEYYKYDGSDGWHIRGVHTKHDAVDPPWSIDPGFYDTPDNGFKPGAARFWRDRTLINELQHETDEWLSGISI